MIPTLLSRRLLTSVAHRLSWVSSQLKKAGRLVLRDPQRAVTLKGLAIDRERLVRIRRYLRSVLLHQIGRIRVPGIDGHSASTDAADQTGDAVKLIDIRRFQWYETSQGIGQCQYVGGTHPVTCRFRITHPLPRGTVSLALREVIRQVDDPNPPDDADMGSEP